MRGERCHEATKYRGPRKHAVNEDMKPRNTRDHETHELHEKRQKTKAAQGREAWKNAHPDLLFLLFFVCFVCFVVGFWMEFCDRPNVRSRLVSSTSLKVLVGGHYAGEYITEGEGASAEF